MAQLIVSQKNKESRYYLNKQIHSAGNDPFQDILVEFTGKNPAFSLIKNQDGVYILPGNIKIRSNGNPLKGKTLLNNLDRIDWDGGCAVYLTSSQDMAGIKESNHSMESLKALHNITQAIRSENGIQGAIHMTLDALVQMSGAEEGYLLTEMGEDSTWELIATKRLQEDINPKNKRELFSNTVLKEALLKKEPVYVESIIGHPWAEAMSVMEARLFSVACFPLMLADRIFGAVFLFTRTPGKVIDKSKLEELNILATQSTLLLASHLEKERVLIENKSLKNISDNSESSKTRFNYHPESKNMLEFETKLLKLAPTQLNLIIQGETGTGKELAAKEIHSKSNRKQGPFVAINCAAIPATLIESLLFGYEKGAFTGAAKSQPGKFLLANKGTLFLDEIGDLPQELQVKLLRVIQEKSVEPLGASKPIPIDVRVVCASHKKIEDLVKKGLFRQDLYYRLNGATLEIPPLRLRKNDIRVLAQNYIKTQSPEKTLSDSAYQQLTNHPFPGNIRELEQVLSRAIAMASTNQIETSDLEMNTLEIENDVFWDEFSTLDSAQMDFTKKYVDTALKKYNGNRAEVAKKLGISERTLYRILSVI